MIQTEPVSSPYTKHISISNIYVNGYAQSFETPRENNHSVTEPSAQVFLGSDSLRCQHNKITYRQGQKLPPPRKYYLCFQMDGKSAHVAQCAE